MAAMRLRSVDFEVFGKVQGVFFRRDTKTYADEHSLVGWVMNTKRKTVVGQLQGDTTNVKLIDEEQKWRFLKSTVYKLNKEEVAERNWKPAIKN